MFEPVPGGLQLRVRLNPAASRDSLDGWQYNAAGQVYLAARVRAVPEKGKANTALVALLARQLSVPKRNIDVIRGATSRLKTIRIAGEGMARDGIVAQLEAFADERSTD